MDGQPVLAITGLQFHDLIGTYTQQDVALDQLFMDVAVYNERIMGPTHVENVVDLAVRTALGLSHGQPRYLSRRLPGDGSRRTGTIEAQHSASHFASRGRWRHAADAARIWTSAAEILNAGKKVAILAGRGALNATAELEQVAEILGAPIVKALLGKSRRAG